MSAFYRQQTIHFMTTLTIVNAIINVGNSIVSSLTGGSSTGSSDSLQKSLDALKDIFLPEDSGQKESRDKRIMKILSDELEKGPISVRPMATSKKTRGRITRRRSDIDGSKQS